jgi:tetratricopeptide (TPR) repeat protein
MSDFFKALMGLGATHAWQGRSAVALPIIEEGIELARNNGEDRLLVYAIAIKHGASTHNISAEGMRELEQAISIGRKNGFKNELIYAIGSYARSLLAQGKTEMAMPYFQEDMELARQINNPRMNATVQIIQCYLARMRGDLEEAKQYALMAIANYEALNEHRSIATVESELAHTLRAAGDFEEAEAYYRQSIIGWQELGHLSAVAHQIECFAFIAIVRGEHEHAAKLLGAAGRGRQELNAPSVDPNEIADLTLAMEQLAEAIGEEQREELLAEGRLMSLDDAVKVALT